MALICTIFKLRFQIYCDIHTDHHTPVYLLLLVFSSRLNKLNKQTNLKYRNLKEQLLKLKYENLLHILFLDENLNFCHQCYK